MRGDLDTDTLERYHRRLAGIESYVPQTAPMSRDTAAPVERFVRAGSGKIGQGYSLVSILVISVLIAVLGLQRLVTASGTKIDPTSRPQGTMAGGSAAALPTTRASGDPAHIRVQVVPQTQQLGGGAVVAPALAPSSFLATITDREGRQVARLELETFTVLETDLAASYYEVQFWRLPVVDNIDSGQRVTGSPEGGCSIEIDAGPGSTTSLSASFSIYAPACAVSVKSSN
jgi:hypothetical protein